MVYLVKEVQLTLFADKLKTVQGSEGYDHSIIDLTVPHAVPSCPALNVAMTLTVTWRAVNLQVTFK